MEYKLPLQLLAEQVAKQPKAEWLNQPVNDQWHTTSWAEADTQARRIASGLLAQGFQPGDRISILAKNCAEWFIADLAIMMAGMVSVPIYFTAGVGTIQHVLNHSACKAIFLGKLDSVAPADQAIPKEVMSIAMPYPTARATQSWKTWLQRYEPLAKVASPQAEDTMTISYTSGSTGLPKGVALSFKNLAAGAFHSATTCEATASDRMFSYLPLAHITERALIEMLSLYAGCRVFFTESLEKFPANLSDARPTIFISVPRLWSKFQNQILKKLPQKKLERLLRIPLLGRFIAWKIRRAMGFDRCRLFGSGTAPISPSILTWFNNIRIPISEGWGMTETTGLACGNIPFMAKELGSIGVPLPSVEMRLSADSEILIRGDGVFEAYYLDPEATAATFTDGWLHTGDMATKRANGTYKIVGRIKEQFKTAKGKYVAPVPIESLLASNPALEQICVMGSGRKQPIALVILTESPAVPDSHVRQALERQLQEVNAQLESHQRLDHIIACSGPWSVENDFLTPTLKVKRNVVEAHYVKKLEHARLTQPVVWESELQTG